MKTDDLISLLSADTLPVARHATQRRISWALLIGLPLSLAIVLIGYGPRRDLVQVMFWPMFWVKVAVPAAVAIAGFVALQALARPGVALRARWLWLLVPVLLLWVLALVSYQNAPVDQRQALVWGQTWRSCAISITLVSLPIFIAAFIALKSLAPTRPALAGACAGAMASGAAAAVYALHCQELMAPFLAIWYVSGMAVPVVIGALLGPRLLRW
jgi:hypothetical protein